MGLSIENWIFLLQMGSFILIIVGASLIWHSSRLNLRHQWDFKDETSPEIKSIGEKLINKQGRSAQIGFWFIVTAVILLIIAYLL